MDRRKVVFGAGSLLGAGALASLFKLKGGVMDNKRAPVLFIGHGSPMNTIEDNAFTRTMRSLGEKLEKPRAILVVSAHWLTAGTYVTSTEKPKMIYDMYGFPEALYDFKYPAPGSPAFAKLVSDTVEKPRVKNDDGAWGLDHGTYSVLASLFPKADVPVLQLSIDMSEPPQFHYELGRELKKLRDQGVLIVGSGNIVHNLRRMDWHKEGGFDWAVEFDAWTKKHLESGDYAPLYSEFSKSEAGRLSVPTPDHYYPLLYVLGASDAKDELKFEYESLEMGAISMRTLSLGRSA